MGISHKKLEQMYETLSVGSTEPNIVLTTAAGWKYIYHKFSVTVEDDFDEFTEWVKSEQEKAKAPKFNKEFRQFVDRRAKISRLGKNQYRGRLQRLGQRR